MNAENLKKIINFIAGLIFGIYLSYKFLLLVCKNKDRRISMFSGYFYTLDKWMTLSRKQYVLEDYLISQNYRSIAVYGIGIMGKQLIAELHEGKVQIIYAIDQKRENSSYPFPVKSLDDDLQKVDIIIVTPGYDYNQIKSRLEEKVCCPIVSLYQLIEGWYEEYE